MNQDKLSDVEKFAEYVAYKHARETFEMANKLPWYAGSAGYVACYCIWVAMSTAVVTLVFGL